MGSSTVELGQLWSVGPQKNLPPRRRNVGIPVAGYTAQDAHGDGILVVTEGDHLQLEVLALLVSLDFLLGDDPYIAMNVAASQFRKCLGKK